MSLIITIKGADFSGFGLPKLEQTVNQFPVDGLQGLYLFDDGAIGADYSEAIDSSGNENHAGLHGNWLAPTRTAAGVNVTDQDGVIFDTGIPLTEDFSVVLCAKNTQAADTSNIFVTHFSDSGNVGTNSKTATIINAERLAINTRRAANGTGEMGLYDAGQTMLGTSRTGLAGDSTQPTIYGLGVSGASGALSVRTLSGFSFDVTDPDIATIYGADLSANTFYIGGWSQGPYRPCTSELHGFAVYNKKLTDTEFTKVISAMDAAVRQRGVSPV